MSDANQKSRVLIIGASSGIGLATTEAALAAGYRVRAFARKAQQISISHPNLQLCEGDALNQADIEAALSDVDVVVQSLGVPFNTKLFTGPIELFSAATKILVPAMQKADCRRLIAVTGFGAGDSQASIHPLQRLGFNLVFSAAYADKTSQEELIKTSDLDWTIVRPGVLSNGARKPSYQILNEPTQWKNGLIARASVAHYIVKAIDEPGSIGKEPVLIN